MEKQDFTEKAFILISISKDNQIEKTSKHSCEEDARKRMTKKEEAPHIIIHLSSKGGNGKKIAPYKSESIGSINGEVVHVDEGLGSMAKTLVQPMIDKYGYQLRNVANKKRKAAKKSQEGQKAYT